MGRLQAADGRLARAERGLKWAALGATDGRYTAGLLRKRKKWGRKRGASAERKGVRKAEQGSRRNPRVFGFVFGKKPSQVRAS